MISRFKIEIWALIGQIAHAAQKADILCGQLPANAQVGLAPNLTLRCRFASNAQPAEESKSFFVDGLEPEDFREALVAFSEKRTPKFTD